MQIMQSKDLDTVYSTLTQLQRRGEVEKAEKIIKNIPPPILVAPIPTTNRLGKTYLGYNLLGKCLVNHHFDLADILMQQAFENKDILLDELNSVINAISRGIFFADYNQLKHYKFLLDKMIAILKPNHQIWNEIVKIDDYIEGNIIVVLIKQNLLSIAKLMLEKGITINFRVRSDISHAYQHHPVVQAFIKGDYQLAKKILTIPSCFPSENSFWNILYHLLPSIEEITIDGEMTEVLKIIIQNCPNLENRTFTPLYSHPMNLLEYALTRQIENLAILLLQSKKFSASQTIISEGRTYNVLMFCIIHFYSLFRVVQHLVEGDYYYHADFINNLGETALIVGAKVLPPRHPEWDAIMLAVAKNTPINWDLSQIENKPETTALSFILQRNRDMLPSKSWFSWKKKEYWLLEDKEITFLPETVNYLREKTNTQSIDL